MKLIVSVFLCVFAFTRLLVSGMTLCKPESKFEVDCNVCTCSKTGREYSCTDNVCEPINYKQLYDKVKTREGYVILVPKGERRYVFDDDNNFDLNEAKVREARNQPLPYIDDEIPLSREEADSRDLVEDDDNEVGDADNEVGDENENREIQKQLESEEARINANRAYRRIEKDDLDDGDFNRRNKYAYMPRGVIN